MATNTYPKGLTGLYYLRALKDRGYSFVQIAKLAGISKRSTINWYHGYTKPNPVFEEMVRIKLGRVFNDIADKVYPRGYILYRKGIKDITKLKYKRRRKHGTKLSKQTTD